MLHPKNPDNKVRLIKVFLSRCYHSVVENRINHSYLSHFEEEAMLHSKFALIAYEKLKKSIAHNTAKEKELDNFYDQHEALLVLGARVNSNRLKSTQIVALESVFSEWLILTRKADNSAESVWYNVQSFLNSSAMISKFLWGESTNDANKRAYVRKKLGVDDSSLLSDRKIRNHFEHFDERLETWLAKREQPWLFIDRWIYNSDNGDTLPKNIKNDFTNKLVEIDFKKICFRFLDSSKMELIFRGELYSLKLMKKEIQFIKDSKTTKKYKVGSINISTLENKEEVEKFLSGAKQIYKKRPDTKTVESFLKANGYKHRLKHP